MQPNIENNTVLLDMEERNNVFEAYDTVRNGVNIENLPECLRPKELRLAEPNLEGLTEVTEQRARSLGEAVVSAIKISSRKKHHYVTEYAEALDVNPKDPLLEFIQDGIMSESERITRFQKLNGAFGAVLQSFDESPVRS